MTRTTTKLTFFTETPKRIPYYAQFHDIFSSFVRGFVFFVLFCGNCPA
jgi:hypothetical protein